MTKWQATVTTRTWPQWPPSAQMKAEKGGGDEGGDGDGDGDGTGCQASAPDRAVHPP